MKILLLSTLLWSAFAGGDRERGMQLYKAGKYAEAQAAFAAALKDDPESAELQWNLALAAWRAGDLPTAEVAAEKYAANSDDVKEELHRGMLGTIRLAQSAEFEAKADAALAAAQAGAVPLAPEEEAPDPLALLKTALMKAATAKRHFVRGVRANPTPELLRNTERTLRKIAELEKRIEELEKQKQEQQKKEGDKNPDDKKPDDKGDEEDKKKSDEQKGDQKEDDKKPEDQKGDDKKPDDQKEDDKKPGDKKSDKSDPKEGEGEEQQESPEPKPNEEEKPEPKPSEQEGKNGESDPNEAEKPENPEPGDEQEEAKEGQPPTPPEPKPGEQRNDAPGEGGKGLELSPEQAQRLLARAKKLDEQLKKAKARRTTRRRAVERDW
ncbi:MAG: hypothetical protein ACI89X_004017 [Planctomycetota bacterium]|jgi:hypothetical protein